MKRPAMVCYLVLSCLSCQKNPEKCIDLYEKNSEIAFADFNWIDLFFFKNIDEIYTFNDTTTTQNIAYVVVNGKKIPVEIRRLKRGIVDYFDYGIPVHQDEHIGADSLIQAIDQAQELLEADIFKHVYFEIGVAGEIEKPKVLERINTILGAVCLSTPGNSKSQANYWPIVIGHYLPQPALPPYLEQEKTKK